MENVVAFIKPKDGTVVLMLIKLKILLFWSSIVGSFLIASYIKGTEYMVDICTTFKPCGSFTVQLIRDEKGRDNNRTSLW